MSRPAPEIAQPAPTPQEWQACTLEQTVASTGGPKSFADTAAFVINLARQSDPLSLYLIHECTAAEEVWLQKRSPAFAAATREVLPPRGAPRSPDGSQPASTEAATASDETPEVAPLSPRSEYGAALLAHFLVRTALIRSQGGGPRPFKEPARTASIRAAFSEAVGEDQARLAARHLSQKSTVGAEVTRRAERLLGTAAGTGMWRMLRTLARLNLATVPPLIDAPTGPPTPPSGVPVQ